MGKLCKLMEVEGEERLSCCPSRGDADVVIIRRPIYRRRFCRGVDRWEEAGRKSFGWPICVELGVRDVIQTLSLELLQPWKYTDVPRESCVSK